MCLRPPDPARALAVAEAAARAAGEAIRNAFATRQVLAEKSPRDVLSAADLAAEAAALRVIRQAYPDHAIVSEEAGALGTGSLTWVVDPLDGTNNFVLGIPYFASSVCLLAGGNPAVGAVYQPILDECFVAQAGQGARMNGHRLPVGAGTRTPADLSRAIVSWIQGHGVAPDDPGARRWLERIGNCCRRVLQTWAPALDWCLLARGDIHVLVSYHSEPEDQYAGLLVAREAGAVVTDHKGVPWEPGMPLVVAAGHPVLHRQVLQLLGD